MHILLITPASSLAAKIKQLLLNKGVTTTCIDPLLTQPLDLELLTQHLSTHPIVAKMERDGIGVIMNNLRLQKGIREGEILGGKAPDMWVQFGSNIQLMQELGLNAELIAERLLQEFFAHDDRPIPQREEEAVV